MSTGTRLKSVYHVLGAYRNLVRNHRIQRWCKKIKKKGFIYHDELGYSTEEKDNVVFIILHSLWHFLFERVGLRQMMDLYFVLRANQGIDISSEIYEFGLEQFSSACSWGLWRVFEDGDNSSFLLTGNSPLPNEREGKFLLYGIIQIGNFGHYDERKTILKSDFIIVKL